MNTRDFFARVLPSGPYLALAWWHRGDTKGMPTHEWVRTADQLAQVTAKLVSKNKTVFHACASFNRPTSRTAGNAHSLKSFYLDLDVGSGKPYGTWLNAQAAVDGFVKDVGLPPPLYVMSGRGLHVYWTLVEAIPVAEWLPLAQGLKALCVRRELHADPAITADAARILRPIGSFNLKQPESPVQVRLIEPGEDCTVDFFRNALGSLGDVRLQSGSVPSTGLPTYLQGASAADNDSLAIEYPPSNAPRVADNCSQIAFFRDTGSDNEPHWRNAIGVIKHCVDGDAAVHTWSSKFEGYDKKETQRKLDLFKHAPTKCDTFANYKGLCDGCKFKGKITSPIQLGVEEPAEPVKVEVTLDEDTTDEILLPKGYGWQGGALVAYKKTEDGTVTTLPFCNQLFFPYARFRSVEGPMVLGIKQRVRKTKDGDWQWRTFTLDTQKVGERGRSLMGELGKHEIVPTAGGSKLMENYMAAYLDMLRAKADEMSLYRTFGWQVDGSFMHGTTVYMPDGTTREVLLNGDMHTVAPALMKRGNAKAWISIIDQLYNRPGFEKQYFVLYAGFGSALVGLLGMPTGCPINLYGGRGSGKTTVGLAAISIYGQGSNGLSIGAATTTYKALISRLSSLNSIPSLIDEITNFEGKQVGRLMYDMANATPYDRLQQTGARKQSLPQWSNINFTTSNASLIDKITGIKENATAELSRFIEVGWGGRAAQTFALSDVEAQTLIRQLQENTGAVAPIYLKAIVQNRDAILQKMEKLQRKIADEVGLEQDTRFWGRMGAAILMGGKLATALGLLHHDWNAVYEYTIQLLRQQKRTVDEHEDDPIDSFNAMVNSFAPAIISTETDDRDNLSDSVRVIEEPIGRYLRRYGVLYLTVSAINKWCAQRQSSMRDMADALKKEGLLLEHDARYRLGKGTKIASAQVRCWKIKWEDDAAVAPNTGHLKVVK